MFQIRPSRGVSNNRDPFYSPERDIAYVGPSMILIGLKQLEMENKQDFLEKLCSSFDISENDLIDAVDKLGKAIQQIFVANKDLATALKESEFDNVKPEIKAAVFAAIGKAFLVGVWTGVRDVNKPQDEPLSSLDELVDLASNYFMSSN